MLIGILQTGHVPDALRADTPSYPAMFEALLAGRGLTFRSYPVVDGSFPEDVHEAEGWLITGSRYGAYEKEPFIARLEDFVLAAYAAHVPIVGICFGHQIIAQALGGRVEKFAGGWAVGPQSYDFDGTEVRLNAWHQDQVVALPPEAEVIARNDFCENAALLYGDRAYSVQAHPEFQDSYIAGLIETRAKGVVPDDKRDAARAALGGKVDSEWAADRIADFFKQPRGQDE